MKYYFITYQATNRQGSVSIWNDVIDKSPMEFIIDIERAEEMGSDTYYNFRVLNTLVLSKEEFDKFKGHF